MGGDKKGEKKADDDEEDPRLEFFMNYLIKSMKIKQEKWNKMLMADEFKKIVMDFLDKPDETFIVFTVSASGLLQPFTSFPSGMKNKSSYFIKRAKEKVTKENFRTLFIFGDASSRPVDELATLVEEIFVPLLSNPENHTGWPAVVAEDVTQHIHTFRNTVTQIKGALQHQTLLAMPPGIHLIYEVELACRESNGETVDLYLKAAIEGVIIKWATQINDILKENSTIAFAEGAHPTPQAEVEFWKDRLKNLESIYDQMRDPRVKKMASYLELTNSTYLPCLKSLFRNVVSAVTEARDITLYLKPMEKYFNMFEDQDILENDDNILPMFHCLCLVWVNSRYYCNSSKIIVLLQEMSNMMIGAADKQLDPGSLFQGDVDEAIMKVDKSINILRHFMQCFEEHRDKLHTYFPAGIEPIPWAFHPRMIFQRIMLYIDRLELVYDVFSNALEYYKLERVVVAGMKGRDLTVKVEQILEEFNKLYNVFMNITYEPLEPELDNFVVDYKAFKEGVLDLDKRLAAIAVQGFDECHTLIGCVKMINIWGQLLDRPVIRELMQPKYKKLMELEDEQLDVVKILFDKGLDDEDYFVDIHLPPVAAKLFWIHKLRCRIKGPMDEFQDLENLILLTEEGEQLQLKFEEMMDLLEMEEYEVFTEWAASVPQQCNTNLSKPLLIRSDELLLALNFDPELVAILREVRYMNILEREDMPEEAMELFSRVEELHRNILNLNRTVQWYNWLRTRTKSVELDLITNQVKEIDDKIDNAIETLDWTQDVWEIINGIHLNVKDLYDRVFQAQVNLRKVLSTMDKWAVIPLYDRKDGKKDQLLYLGDKIERRQKRYKNVQDSADDIALMLDENYKLFFKVEMPKSDLDEEEEEEEEELASPTPVPSRKGKRKEKGDKPGKEVKEGKEAKKGKKGDEEESPRSGKGGKGAKGKKADEEDSPKAGKKGKGKKGDEEDSPKGGKKGKGKKGKGKKGKSEDEDEDKPLEEFGEEAPLSEYEMSEEERQLKWEAYLNYVDVLIGDMLLKAVMFSFGVFLSEMEQGRKAPLFEVALELQDPYIRFVPSLDEDEDDCFYYIMKSLIEDIIVMCEMIPRVAENTDSLNYRSTIENNLDIVDLIKETLSRVQEGTDKAVKYSEGFEKYSYLWLDNRQAFLKQFLTYGRILTPEEVELLADENYAIKEVPPTIAQFKEQIDLYEDLYQTVAAIELVYIIDSWLRIDVRPLRQAILNTVCKWGNLFKQHLVDHVVNSLDELESFCIEANAILQKELNEDDYDGLLKVMEYLFKVKDRQLTTDGMFEPLKEIIELLKQYGVEFDEEVHVQLAELPDKWTYTKKLAVTTKQLVAPLQANQVNLLRKRITLFDIRQGLYKDAFKKMAFFKYECEEVYPLLDKTNDEIKTYEAEMKKLEESAGLFEVNLPEFKAIKQCRKEIRQLKQLWDYVYIVRSCIDEWKMTPWKKIDVENMEMECKKFAKEIKGFDKELRGWDPYIQIEGTVKNMLTSLRAVTELQNPAIRERHWKQLMQTTKVKFVMDDKTTLKDLLDLNLHEYEEEVKNIVDKSVKEMSMEKTLKELNAVWSAMEFDTDIHERTKLKLLRASEELIETLEDNQVQLQNLMTSKFIDYFLEEVSEWQRTLSIADQVIGAFFEVQRKWMYLESIFIGSEDIRSQLPEDSKRFERIDREFKEILGQMNVNLNVVKATSKPNLYEKLDGLLSDLILCEKALNDYLETKRLAFPRFYFVSSADLLDILSNGNQPELVQRHLTKLYDSIAKLRFVQEGGKNTKQAKGMISKEHDEFVAFLGICDCNGKVEIWLNRVTDAMRQTLHRSFQESVVAYDEKPREQWLYDWPAQPALCGTQIWWTTEVNIAFSRLEEGYENALKDYQKKQIQQLSALIVLLLGDLTAGDRQKIMTICTIDVHSRDVVAKMITAKVETSSAFQWQSQLRHRWDEKLKNCYANICDAQFLYQYEYLGNTPRLVITPLTDRCYITLTQSLHLIMGGAPAGPAGTGKTETTKDLGRALGIMVYVFNCSEQMDYRSCGNIYKGLAQTGAWGCFDEFNRISVEVLSVVAVQVKSIQDAIKTKKTMFNFMGEDIVLLSTVGLFITMNPGYAGRTELPENLKALFRPCAMVVPDFELICEIMLVAEGFQEARLLARKFITLYTLCKELLSKQDHYDWGLRAIKSVLVVAGSLKRSDRQRPEDQVLMRALRDFNIPKIITDDVPVFMGLIGDLFPALDVPRKRDLEFEKIVKKSVVDLKLQAEDNFVLKIVQLEELFAVRHSVFIIGNPGTGKTMVWKSLYKTYQNQKRKPFYNDLDPKAVTNDELFGIINPATREWKDGLFSVIMRDQANMTGDGPKWIVLDGDIDPMWIESLNTVMDDNKVLTLASNERIALTKAMRLLFEISNLRTATPATVSRAGILYINPADLGWNPYITSWIDTRTQQSERANLIILFDKYVPPCLEVLRLKFKTITPIPETSHLNMICYLLDSFLTPTNVPPECPKEWYEIYFVFACIWAFGSALFQDQLVDWRNEFSKWWTNEFKTVKFPTTGTVFSYFIDPETKKFLPWSELVKGFELDPDIPLQATIVHTMETTRLRFFLDILVADRHPVMLVGSAGSGKTVIVADKLTSLPDSYAVTNVPFNFYTTSEMLQKVLEKPLEKKAGRNFGPPGNKSMIYFIDDMNMPEVDTYGTVQPHTLIREHMDYGHWYDRIKLSLKEIHNVQYISCMNPTAGSFTIDGRLQRHFCVFACSFPSPAALTRIYTSILSQHLDHPINKVPILTQKICDHIVEAALSLHLRLSQTFLPTAIKFHYIFNLRDLSNIFTGILFATGECIPNPMDLIRLWMHEATRVYCDKFVDKRDVDTYSKIIAEIVKKGFEELDENYVMETPLVFCHFAEGIGDPKYLPLKDWNTLAKLLNEALSSYNDLVGAMNLVLFEDAMYHVCRINRILEAPRGNALLVGVGGSGKQSLSRLAAFISSLDVFQVQLRKGYTINDLKANLATLYFKAGVKSTGSVFLMTDAQVPEEIFLVLINDMLASGEIPELFADDEIENIIGAMRPEVKGAGLQDTREICWKFFIDRCRRLLKIVLCFSPVGSTLRIRARKFPALVNCTSINWFHEWPREALLSVSKQFLSELEVLPAHLVDSISNFMSFVHTSVNEMSHVYLTNDKRYNYTTPKSFLEQIALYSKLLAEKMAGLDDRIIRLSNGLQKLASTTDDVDVLKVQLASQEVVLKQKNDAADALIQVLSVENEAVAKEQAIAADEEARVTVIEEDVSAQAAVCAEDLRKAEPALIAAQEALNTLNKNNLTELKSFGTPPDAVVNVSAAVLVLFSEKGKVPKDRSWKACKGIMGKVDQFLNDLINYDKENIHPDVQKAILPYINDPEFQPEKIMAKSIAAAGLCAWVINIMKFYDVYVVVEPKRRALNKANAELAEARQKLADLKEKLTELQRKLGILKADFEEATEAKLKCQAEADATAYTINLANRLINGLASENVRWRELIKTYEIAKGTLPGDILLSTAFLSYVGCFSKSYRTDLETKHWLPYFATLEPPVPMAPGLDCLSLLTDDAQIAQWNNEGLPTDRMSTENATIMINSTRWPLLIDPQLQGIKWVKNKYSENLTVIRLGMKNYLDTIERCISNGEVVLIEYIGESVDAVLDPLLGRALIKKGKVIKIGDKEVDFDPNFRLILQTKLANPHYKPEMQAQTTLINFTVTRDGLEEQLLAEVVKAERPDLEELKTELTTSQNNFKITLKTLEDDLLFRLSNAGANILSDIALVENLETTKRTANEIEVKVTEAKITGIKIDEAREHYRKCATRASLLYFILNELHRINAIYLFSLKAFSVVFKDAIAKAEPAEKLTDRVENLLDCITFSVYMYTSRGLFEKDKLIFMCLMTLQILVTAKEVNPEELDFLLRYPIIANLQSPVEFLSNQSWGGIKAIARMDEFRNLDKDIQGSSKRWLKFVESDCPEREKFPQEWKNKSALQRLCMMRPLRPDRMTYAVTVFVEEKLGNKFVEARTVEFAKSYEETSASVPTFFILSPGVDPLKDVEKLGKKLGMTTDNRNFHNVSLGQGQEEVAENAMELASREGHWVILQNIHLVSRWLSTLEKKMEQYSGEGTNEKYRLFISAEPNPDPQINIIPQGILESSIKITNEPPTGMLANLHKALDNFNQETLEMCSKEAEFKAILFSLCYFHAVVAERRKFGAQGWNRVYPFNVGDLTISINVLYNYLENNNKIPWEDLRYLFGEIMYGGHITDDWDRRLCRTFLGEYMQPELVDGDLFFATGFPAPPNTDYVGYHRFIDDFLPAETPNLYGLHPNAEIGFLTTTADNLFKTIFEMQPKDTGGGGGQTISREDKVKQILEDILDKLPEEFNIVEIMAKVEERTPYIIVAFQECERMNILTREMRRTLKELELGLKGELTITSDMEKLEGSLFMDYVPDSWTKRAYPSLLPLGLWFADFQIRLKELENWASDFSLPSAVWLAGFFNPQSFLTAIMQQTARKNEWPLDKMCLYCDVTKKTREEFTAAPREGAYVHGLYMEGARWDTQLGSIGDSKLKELFPLMPVIYIKAITQDKQDLRNMYECPVYKTRMRGPTFVWTFNLRTKEKAAKWTLAGVALLLQI